MSDTEFSALRGRMTLSRESWSELAITIIMPGQFHPERVVTHELIGWLRERGYPVPVDCSHSLQYVGPPRYCVDKRPACAMGICKRAVMIAGDW